jgi:hypothetical protein
MVPLLEWMVVCLKESIGYEVILINHDEQVFRNSDVLVLLVGNQQNILLLVESGVSNEVRQEQLTLVVNLAG